MRLLMYIVVIVIGVIVAIVGFTTDAAADPTTREWFIGLGIGAVLVGIYAWIRNLGPIGSNRPGDPPGGPGFRFDFWPDGIVILALLAISVIVSILIF